MSTTMLTLLNGRTLEVRGTYEDLTAMLRARTLSADDGRREVTLADGERITLAMQMVGLIEQARERTRGTFGFSRALEATA